MKNFLKYNINKILLIIIYVAVFYGLAELVSNICGPLVNAEQELYLFQFLLNAGIYIVLITSGLILLSSEIKTDINVIKKMDAMKVFKWCLIAIGLSYAGSYIGGLITMIFTGGSTSDNQTAINGILSSNYAIPMMIFIAFIGPIVEELVFRKSLHGIMRYLKFPVWLIILISSLLFGAIHINFNSLKDIIHILQYSAIGVGLGIMECKTKNIVPCIIAHMFINALSLAMIFGLEILGPLM